MLSWPGTAGGGDRAGTQELVVRPVNLLPDAGGSQHPGLSSYRWSRFLMTLLPSKLPPSVHGKLGTAQEVKRNVDEIKIQIRQITDYVEYKEIAN